MGLITPGYLTGLYHPDRYFMADYYPEYGTAKFVRGAAGVSDPLAASPLTSSRPFGAGVSDPLGSNPSIT